jgi:hypothetical protein
MYRCNFEMFEMHTILYALSMARETETELNYFHKNATTVGKLLSMVFSDGSHCYLVVGESQCQSRKGDN